jgi:soluble lytic murein transglycosylase-like protein
LWFALLLVQDPRSQADRIRAAMAKSLEQQRASVMKQMESVGPIGSAPAPIANCTPIPQPELSKMIDEVAAKQGVDKDLVREVARQESGFKPCAVSSAGAEGLMQLMPATQAQFQVSDPFDPKQSLEAGSKMLKSLLDRYHGDLKLALSAYNAGPGNVDKAGGVPDIPETKAYVLSILTRFLQ